MSKLKTVDDVRHEREMLEYEVDAFLRKKGWEHSSSTPGCYWLWSKELTWTNLAGQKVTRYVLTDKATALSLQSAMDRGT